MSVDRALEGTGAWLDDRLHGARCNVVLGGKVEFIETGSYLEGVGDTLLVRFATVAPHMRLVYAVRGEIFRKQTTCQQALSQFCTRRGSSLS